MLRTLKSLVRRVLPKAMVGRIRQWRIERIVGRFVPRIVRHSYGGHELVLRLTDPLAVGWYDHDWPVLAEVSFLVGRRPRSGVTVFDLGAHHGVVALMLAREVGPTGTVVAVEANPHNAAAASENARLNAADNVTVRCAAVAERGGTLTFNIGLNGQVDDGSGKWGRATVEAVTIDQLTACHGPPAVLFIDVEGFECQALRGATTTLTRHRPDWFVEVHIGVGLESFGSVAELLTFFPPDQYELFSLDADDCSASPTPATRESVLAQTVRFYLLAIARE